MILPRIVLQTSPRWFVVSKPRGWSLASRGQSDSIERFLAPIASSNNKIYFPVELDSRIQALAIVCTDRGMQAQFEKFKAKNQFEVWYRVVVTDTQDLPSTGEGISVTQRTTDEMNWKEVDVSSDRVLRMSKLDEILSGKIVDNRVNLYKLRFPDPFNPRSENITISAEPFDPNVWAKKEKPQKLSDTEGTHSPPESTSDHPDGGGEFYIVEKDGTCRPASPALSPRSSFDKYVEVSPEIGFPGGQLVFVDEDGTALVFDGMEVLKFHFDDLSPVSGHTVTEDPDDKGQFVLSEVSENTEDDASQLRHVTDENPTEPSSTTTTTSTYPTTATPQMNESQEDSLRSGDAPTADGPVSPPRRPSSEIKPETEEFLLRLRHGLFVPPRVGSLTLGGTLPMTSRLRLGMLGNKYIWSPQVKVPLGVFPGIMGQTIDMNLAANSGNISSDLPDDLDDIYFEPASERQRFASKEANRSTPKPTTPHLFYFTQSTSMARTEKDPQHVL